MKKNPGRKERRRLTRQNRVEDKPRPAAIKQAPRTRKQNPKWFNRRKKVYMTRTWAKEPTGAS